MEEPSLKMTITGRIPSKKNSRRRIIKGKRIFDVPSEAYEAWHNEVLPDIKSAYTGETLKPPYRIIAFIWAPDKRASDLSNKWQSIEDILKDASVIVDDNWFCIKDLHLIFAGVDKKNPRIEFEIFSEVA